MELTIGICVAFALAIGGAAFLFWLADRAKTRQEALAGKLQEFFLKAMEADRAIILSLADRVQSPTAQAFSARQEAVAKAAVASALSPEERKEAARELAERERNLTVQDYFSEQRWKNDNRLTKYTNIQDDGDEVILEWEENGMPFMDRMPQGEFVMAHVLRPRI